MLRLVFGFLLCALAYPAVMLAGVDEAALGIAMLVGTLTAGALAIAGLPLLAWFLKNRWFGLRQLVLAGTMTGLALSLPFALLANGAAAIEFAVFCAEIGAVHAFAFWLLAVWRNNALGPLADSLCQRYAGPVTGRQARLPHSVGQ